MMDAEKAFPYFLTVIKKSDSVLASVKAVNTIFGEPRIMFTLKQDVIDPLTDKQLYIGDQFPSTYRNIDDLRYRLEMGDIGTNAIPKQVSAIGPSPDKKAICTSSAVWRKTAIPVPSPPIPKTMT
jgi:hypothetical protein